MTLATELSRTASEISLCAPGQSGRLHALAGRVRAVEFALNELAEDARESAELAEADAAGTMLSRAAVH